MFDRLFGRHVVHQAQRPTGKYCTSALLNVAAEGDINKLKKIIAAGMLNDRDHVFGQLALIIAAYNNHYDAVDMLLQNGAIIGEAHFSITNDAFIQVTCEHYTPGKNDLSDKHYTYYFFNLDPAIRALAQKWDAGTNDQNSFHKLISPFKCAALNKNTRMLALLQKHARANAWLSPYHLSHTLAIGLNQQLPNDALLHIIKLNKHRCDRSNRELSVALNYALQLQNEDAAMLLAQHGARSLSALPYAIERDNEKLLVSFIESGIRAKDALHMAIKLSRYNLIAIFLSHKLYSKDALLYAVSIGNQRATIMLLDAGLPINHRGKKIHQGITPLICAAKRGDRDMVQLLLDRGAKQSTISTISGKTARQVAESNGHAGVARLLGSNMVMYSRKTSRRRHHLRSTQQKSVSHQY